MTATAKHKLAASLMLVVLIAAQLAAEPPQLQMEHKSPVLCVAWSPKGQWIATGTQDGTICITEVATGKTVNRFAAGDAVLGMAFGPDGKKLAISQLVKSLSTWDIATGTEISVNNIKNYSGEHVAFTPDGQTIVVVSYGKILQWRLPGALSGSQAKMRSEGFAAIAADASVSGWTESKGLMRINFHDGKAAKTTTWDLGETARCIAFSATRKLLAVGGDKDVTLWDWQAKNKTATLTGLEKPAVKLSFAAEANTLAALAADGASIQVWDLTRNLNRRQIHPNRGAVGPLALSPDGKLLATTSIDNKVLIFNVATRELTHKGPAEKLSAKEMADLWDDLANPDSKKADSAWHKLGAAGDNAVAFLLERMRPIAVPPKLDRAKIEKLVAELDADRFAVRERATKELTAAGEWAVVPLQSLLKEHPTGEAATRANLVLKKIGLAPLTPDRLRVLEAIELLEQIRTANAIAALEEIERTAAVVQIRAEASQALERLMSVAQKKD